MACEGRGETGCAAEPHSVRCCDAAWCGDESAAGENGVGGENAAEGENAADDGEAWVLPGDVTACGRKIEAPGQAIKASNEAMFDAMSPPSASPGVPTLCSAALMASAALLAPSRGILASGG
mmetsp:Transcript_23962/g.46389  ORF Transcript_23962/g.46389 Transcript_23962/m.46389 type:complete len:122 (-) Transcript_23962:94-459(-)